MSAMRSRKGPFGYFVPLERIANLSVKIKAKGEERCKIKSEFCELTSHSVVGNCGIKSDQVFTTFQPTLSRHSLSSSATKSIQAVRGTTRRYRLSHYQPAEPMLLTGLRRQGTCRHFQRCWRGTYRSTLCCKLHEDSELGENRVSGNVLLRLR